MDNNSVYSRLYEKALDEQSRYKNKLLTLQPEEVLRNAYEYHAHEDILAILEFGDSHLSPTEADALLRTKYPLTRLYNDWIDVDDATSRLDKVVDSVKDTAKELVAHDRRRVIGQPERSPHFYSGPQDIATRDTEDGRETDEGQRGKTIETQPQREIDRGCR
jgi:hypothetical protein